MIRTQHRTKGASALGARQPGEIGPFGSHGARDDEADVRDDTVMTCRTEGGRHDHR